MNKQKILLEIEAQQVRLGLSAQQCGERMGYAFPDHQWRSLFAKSKPAAWPKIERAANALGLQLEVVVK